MSQTAELVMGRTWQIVKIAIASFLIYKYRTLWSVILGEIIVLASIAAFIASFYLPDPPSASEGEPK